MRPVSPTTGHRSPAIQPIDHAKNEPTTRAAGPARFSLKPATAKAAHASEPWQRKDHRRPFAEASGRRGRGLFVRRWPAQARRGWTDLMHRDAIRERRPSGGDLYSRGGSRGCCCGSTARSCCGTPNGSCRRRCSRSRRGLSVFTACKRVCTGWSRRKQRLRGPLRLATGPHNGGFAGHGITTILTGWWPSAGSSGQRACCRNCWMEGSDPPYL
jgi:hypothetical protein